MKNIVLFIFLILLSTFAVAQSCFNIILYDSIKYGRITDVKTFDSASYVVIHAHTNRYNKYNFSAIGIGNFGEKLWEKEKFSDDSINNCFLSYNVLKRKDNGYCFCAKTSGGNAGTGKFSLLVMDSIFNTTYFKDTIGFYEYIGDMQEDSNGDYYFCGQVYDSRANCPVANCVKTDDMGNVLWSRAISNSSVFSSNIRLIFLSDGNILTGGYYNYSNRSGKWMLTKMDTSGNIIWQRYYGRNGVYPNGEITGLLETPDSCFIVSGSYPAVSIDGGYEFYYDGCIRKISADGEQLWEKRYRRYSYNPNSGNVYLFNEIATVKSDGKNIYIIGSEYNDSLCGKIPYLAKLTMDGDIMWKRSYHSEGSYICEQSFHSFDFTPDGGFIMGGDGMYGYIGINPPQQPWIVKTDSLGMDGVCNIEPPALNIDIDFPDTLYCGDTLSCMMRLSGKSAPYQVSFSTGQTIDSIYYPEAWMPLEMDTGYVSIINPQYTYATFHETEATIVGLNLEQCIHKPIQVVVPNRIGVQQITIEVRDFYGESKTITKEINVVGDCVSGIENIAEQSVSVYPNPASESITIAGENIVEIEICNLLGEVVYEMQQCNGNNVISTDGMGAGSYFVRVTMNDGKVVTKKIVVM